MTKTAPSSAVARKIKTDQQKLIEERSPAGQGAPFYISPAIVRVIRQAQNQYGDDVGPVIGNRDAQIRHATVNVQEAYGTVGGGGLITINRQALFQR